MKQSPSDGSKRWAIWKRMRIMDAAHPGRPYLDRLRIFQSPYAALYKHDIYTRDPQDPHDHPYPFVSIILRGGYTEIIYTDPATQLPYGRRSVRRRRFSAHLMRQHWAHRIINVDPGTITLVLVGRRVSADWGFWRLRPRPDIVEAVTPQDFIPYWTDFLTYHKETGYKPDPAVAAYYKEKSGDRRPA